jgi:hypothetical protein
LDIPLPPEHRLDLVPEELRRRQMASLTNWVMAEAGAFDRSLTPDEIMDRLEKRVGPKGRKLFERFLRQVNKLQMQQHLEAQAQTGDNGGR